MALFTGARLEELGQLRQSDVIQISYADADGLVRSGHFLRLTEDIADGLTLKNAKSERDVPLHPELIRMGFLDYFEAVRARGETRLFHDLRPNIYGTLTAKWGEWFGRYKRETCNITDRRMTFHSFRHTFKQYARHVGIDEGVQRKIMGHSVGDVADKYGTGITVHQLVEGMAMYRVTGLTLPAPLQLG